MPTGRRSASSASAPTKANVKEGEFEGVELTFMGLNNQNLHNFLFRGFLKPWEAYTGAKITWIDLAQADYNAAPAAVDRHRHRRLRHHRDGRAVRGRRLRQGPRLGDARLGQEADRHGRLRRLPEAAGRHLGRQDLPHLDRRRLPQLQLPHRRLRRRRPRQGLEGRGRRRANGACRRPGSRCRRSPSSSRARRSTARTSTAISTRPSRWGGFGFYFLGSRATAYAKHPGRQGLAVRRRHDEAARQQPGLGARHPGRDRRAAVRAGRPDQRRSRTPPPSSSSSPAPARCSPGGATSARTPRPTTPRSSATSVGFSILPGSDDVYNAKTGAVGQARRAARTSRRTWPISAGASTSWPASTATRRSRRRPGARRPISAARTSRSGRAAYPSGFQPYRNSHFNIPEWVAAGYDEAFITSYLNSEADSYNHPNAAIEPRIPGIFQYYSVAEDELAKIFAGQIDAQDGRRRHRRGLGEDHRPDRPRQPDQALQGLARHVALRA